VILLVNLSHGHTHIYRSVSVLDYSSSTYLSKKEGKLLAKCSPPPQ